MRVIVIDPDKQLVEEREVEDLKKFLSGFIGSWILGHWIVPHFIPDHDAYVDEEGLHNKRTCWLFGNVHIWGPMILVGSKESQTVGASTSIERVKDLVNFSKPRYLS